MTDEHIQEWPDIMFTAKATTHGHYVEFVIYAIMGFGDDGKGNYTAPIYTKFAKEGSAFLYDDADWLDDAAVYLHGTVKWDGCSDWLFDDNAKNRMLHGCGRKDLSNIGEALTRCWDWAAELIPDTWLV